MAIPIIGDIIGKVLDIGGKLVPDRAAQAAAKAAADARQQELDAALHQKQLEQIGQAESYEAAWNLANAQAAATSWKDEFWTIVLSVPLVMAFVPFMVKYVVAGFAALEQTPAWYRYFVGVAISAAFGFQQANKVWSWIKTP